MPMPISNLSLPLNFTSYTSCERSDFPPGGQEHSPGWGLRDLSRQKDHQTYPRPKKARGSGQGLQDKMQDTQLNLNFR